MHRHLPLALIFLAFLGLSSVAFATPQWIWGNKELVMDGKRQEARLRKDIEVPAGVTKATWTVAADAQAILFLDGRELGGTPNVGEAEAVDLTPLFAGKAAGKRTLGLRVNSSMDSSKAGVVAELRLERARGEPIVIETDASWLEVVPNASDWTTHVWSPHETKPVKVLGPLGNASWPKPTMETFVAAKLLPPRTAPAADAFTTLPGYHVELLYNVPKYQGSWTALCVDGKGRLIASDQYGPLYRITPPPLHGKAEDTKVEELPIAMGHANGLLWAFGSLYVMVCHEGSYEHGSGIYRVTFKPDGDTPDKVEFLRKIHGDGDHGPHALMLSPDGQSITMICGNNTKLPELQDSRVPNLYQEDQVLPKLVGHGFMMHTTVPAAFAARMSPDGKTLTLLSMGMRNPYDGAFNRAGELFTYDADMENDVEMPWYRPTRICHLVDGADFGWRSCSGKQREYYVDTAPPVYNVGRGCPTGMTFGYGAKFPAKYQEALFMCDWTFGKLYAVHLQPSGATYTADLETFFETRPLPLTDIAVNPKDGAMYFITGGRRGTSGFYRVSYEGSESTAPTQPGPDSGVALRALRHHLESFFGKQDPKAIELALPLLSHPDRVIRYAARTALEFQPSDEWANRALALTAPDAVLNTGLALARLGRKDLAPRIWENFLRLDLPKLGEPTQLDVLRAIGVTCLRLGDPAAEQLAALVKKLDAMYPSQSARVNFELCQLLVRCKAPDVAVKTMPLFPKASNQEEQIGYAQSLRLVTWGWTPVLREQQFRWFLREKFNRNDNLAKFIADIRKDAVASLSDAEKIALKPVLEAKPEVQPLPAVASRVFVKHWETNELLAKVEVLLKQKRDAGRGHKLFRETGCVVCHSHTGEGGAVGPDLTLVGGRFGPREIVESIIEPSKVISDQFGTTIVTTKDGNAYMGRLAGESAEMVQVQENLYVPSDVRTIARKDILKIEASPISLMPPALIDTCQPEEAADLVYFLINGLKAKQASR